MCMCGRPSCVFRISWDGLLGKIRVSNGEGAVMEQVDGSVQAKGDKTWDVRACWLYGAAPFSLGSPDEGYGNLPHEGGRMLAL